jgi:hypothetical protein
MPAKSKQSITVVEKMPSVRKARIKGAHVDQMVEMAKPNIDEQWEQIRVRGQQISADIKVLLNRLS